MRFFSAPLPLRARRERGERVLSSLISYHCNVAAFVTRAAPCLLKEAPASDIQYMYMCRLTFPQRIERRNHEWTECPEDLFLGVQPRDRLALARTNASRRR